MTAFPSYSTGTVSVANNGTVVTGVGSSWVGANAIPGDDIVIDGHTVKVMDVTDSLHLVILPWPYPTVSGVPYTILKTSPTRVDGGESALDVGRLVSALNTSGYFVYVAPDETVPDPSYGEEGQFALQTSTGKMWEKTGGAWVFYGTFRGFGTAAPWSGATAYDEFDIATLDGSSYLCILAHTNHMPPNATYWVVLASKGNQGDTGLTGPAGTSVGILQAYSTPTNDADPGAGLFRLNSGSPAAATAAYLDNLDVNGVNVSGIFDLFDDSTSATRGFIRFQKATNPLVWAQYRVTGSVVDGTGYRKLTLASGVASGAFTDTDVFAITFFRSGDSSAGDVQAANNGTEFNAATFAGNLALLRYAAQALTEAQKAQARANIGALKKNYIVNGAMMVSQENGAAAGTTSNYYPADQFVVASSNAGTFSTAQVASVTPAGSPNRVRFTVTAADASVGAADSVTIRQYIEGIRVADLRFGSASGKTVTLQFGVKAPAGTYCVGLSNGGVTRVNIQEFTITGPEANTDVVKSVTFTADNTGTWPTDTSAGFVLF